jgi:hypothetical protein
MVKVLDIIEKNSILHEYGFSLKPELGHVKGLDPN